MVIVKDNTDIEEFTESFILRASINSGTSFTATSMPLIQMETVSTMLDSIIRMQMNEITPYIESRLRKQHVFLGRDFLLP